MNNENQSTTVAELNNSWKGRGTLRNLVSELQRQKETRHDFVADVRDVSFSAASGSLFVNPLSAAASEWLPEGKTRINKSAARQVAEKSNPSIPAKFFESMLADRPNELATLINGLHTAGPARRLFRMLDGNIRAFLSDRYRIIDNYDMAFTSMDEAQRLNAQVIEASLSDTHMRLKLTSQAVWDVLDVKQNSGPQGGWYAGAIGNKELQGKTILGAKVTGELPGGPGTVHPVVTISNSETGHGGFNVRLGILMGICYNVATMEDVVSRVHLGGEMAQGIYSEETMAADSKAIILKARDSIRAAFTLDKFKALIATARQSQTQAVLAPTAAIENVLEVAEMPGEHKEALLEYFLRDYDKTQFGLAQAVSRLAQDVDSDDADKLEKMAGRIIKDKSFAVVGA